MLLSMLDAVSKLRLSIAACLFTAIEDGQDCKTTGRNMWGVALKDAGKDAVSIISQLRPYRNGSRSASSDTRK